MNESRIVFPWPPSQLSPNTRQHWAVLAKAKKQYRAACANVARAHGIKCMEGAGALHLSLVFTPPTRRAFDLDNLLARMKSGLDGLADVLGVDDSRWSIEISKAESPQRGGFVEVSIKEKA